MDHELDGQGVQTDDTAEVRPHARDVAVLGVLLAVLAALWTGTFLWGTRSWGEYRPAGAELQEPLPPPDILLSRLTLDQAREIIARAAASEMDSHGAR
jgi:hypothetical protein